MLAQQIAADNVNKLAREYGQTYADRPGALMEFGRQLLNGEVPESWTPERIEQCGAAIQRVLAGVINSASDLKELLRAKGLVEAGGAISSLVEKRLKFLIEHLEAGYLLKYDDDLAKLEVVVKTWEEESGKDGLDGEHAKAMFAIVSSARDVIKEEMENDAAEQ